MSVVVEQKKERIRAALQELVHPTCVMSTCDAMETIHDALRDDHGFNGTTGDFVGDDDFKEEIFSARVIQVVMAVSRDKEKYTPLFYCHAFMSLFCLCSNNTELATAFVTNDGVAFLLECLKTFSSDQFLLATCFTVYGAVLESLDTNELVEFAGMTFGGLIDVFQLNFETQNEHFYSCYCFTVGKTFSLGCEVNDNLLERIVSHVWQGIIKHKDNDEAQAIGRTMLRFLVGAEKAKEMIDHADLRHCAEDYCAGCA
jgi:hypothetical protein